MNKSVPATLYAISIFLEIYGAIVVTRESLKLKRLGNDPARGNYDLGGADGPSKDRTAFDVQDEVVEAARLRLSALVALYLGIATAGVGNFISLYA